MAKRTQRGQGLVEFALIVPVFLVLMMGLFDGTRLVFQYNELQDAARIGARWAAVNVNRDAWGGYGDTGNQSGDWNVANTVALPLTVPDTSSIVRQVARSLTGVPASQTWVNIATANTGYPHDPTYDGCGLATGSDVGTCSGMPVTVTVSYTFTPILSFSMVHIPLQGRVVSNHE